MYSKNYICLQIHCAYSGIPDDYMFFTQMFFSFFLQSALQPLWVLACSTIVEYSQQEGFYRMPLPAARQTPNLGDQWFRTFQLSLQGVPSVWNDASEPQQRKVELWARNYREFCRKWRLPRHVWALLHAVNLRHGTDGYTSPPKESALKIFSPEKSDGFGRVWTREFGYQNMDVIYCITIGGCNKCHCYGIVTN